MQTEIIPCCRWTTPCNGHPFDYNKPSSVNGVAEFLYIVQEFQTAYAKDQGLLAGQSDGSVNIN